jgi:hypothetical protein
MSTIVVVFFVVLAHALPAFGSQEDAWTAHRRVLASYGGDWSTIPTSINNKRQMAGYAINEEGLTIAFFRTAGGRYRTIAEQAAATDINDRGLVVGVWLPCAGCLPEGFAWSPRQGLQTLGGFLPYAVNDHGDMAGECVSEGQACVLRDNAVFAVADPGSIAYGINASGAVVGTYGDRRAFLLTADWEFRDLGHGEADDINDRGVIAGFLLADMGPRGDRALLTTWTKNRPRTPRREVSIGVAINKRNWVIANAFDENELSYSFAWNAVTGSRVLIADVGGPYVQLEDINDRGDIVGTWGTEPAIWSLRRTTRVTDVDDDQEED